MSKETTTETHTVLINQIKEEKESLQQDVAKLHEQIRIFLRQQENFTGQIEVLTKALSDRDKTIEAQRRQLEQLIKRIYGRSSERLNPNQLLFEEVLLESDCKEQPEEPVSDTGGELVIKEHTRKRRGRIPFPEHLERVEHYLDIREDEKQCKHCDIDLNKIGEEITERIDYRPSSLFVNRYIRPKYACGNSNCDGCGVKQHEAVGGAIEKCEAESGLLAQVITEKYEHHNPLYRQELRFKRKGIEISRQTMCGWMERCALVLEPLYNKMREEILEYDIVLNDDTPVDMLEPKSGHTLQTRLWCTVGGEGYKYTMYNFTLGRGRAGPLGFFKGYSGYFVSDAYGGYNELFKDGAITHAGCWAHARRYFKNALDCSPAAGAEILTLIARLYRVEKKIKHLSDEERLNIRQVESADILKEIEEWLKDNLGNHLPQSPMRKGIEYTLGIWKELNVYIEDPRLPIDNNITEQAIRPIALGRKNWLFVGSKNGGHTAAILLSFCVTCRKLQIDTWQYLRDVLSRINDHPMSKIEELLPDRWKAANHTK